MTFTSTITSTGLDDYIESVASEGRQFAHAAEQGDLDVAIAACPGWAMRDLVLHVGEVHLWAAANVAFPKPHWLSVPDLSDLAPYWPELATSRPNDGELVDWYRATHENLLEVLGSAPTDVEAFTFLPAETPLTMWARRQASEIAIHRFDAESARGRDTHFDPHFAGDMLDELVSGFVRYGRRPESGPDRVLHIRADDIGEQWWATIGTERIRTSRDGTHADLTVAGTAAELYLSLWNRTPDSTVALTGDPTIMDLWRETCRFEWSR